MNIPKIPHAISVEEFFQRYFLSECPVVIKDVSNHWDAGKKWSRELITEQLQKHQLSNSAAVGKTWLETNRDFLAQDYAIPPLVTHCLADTASYTRANNCRIWLNDKNNITPFHYDGNAVYVFNVQLIGKKHWTIVSPDTPLSCYPFSRIPFAKYGQHLNNKSYRVYEFELNTGEMLFLPAFWAHRVVSLADENINLSWVGTKKQIKSSATYLREVEILKCAQLFADVPVMGNYIRSAFTIQGKSYLENYGGAGKNILLNELISQVTWPVALKRMAIEFAKILTTRK